MEGWREPERGKRDHVEETEGEGRGERERERKGQRREIERGEREGGN